MDISNFDDVIDSRDVIARIGELESELADAHEAEAGGADVACEFEAWLARIADTDGHECQDAAVELQILRALESEAGGCSDWEHGEALIRDSYFEEYARQLADDCGMVPDNLTWPCDCIDWERAARELQMDYTSVSFDGVDYWIRS